MQVKSEGSVLGIRGVSGRILAAANCSLARRFMLPAARGGSKRKGCSGGSEGVCGCEGVQVGEWDSAIRRLRGLIIDAVLTAAEQLRCASAC
jgi:hypothetical protein